MKQYLINVGSILSQFLNALLGGRPTESLSERTGRAARKGNMIWLRNFIDALFFFDPNHCENTLQYDYVKEVWDWTK